MCVLEERNLQVLECAGLENALTFLTRVKFSFPLFFPMESLYSENITVTSCHIKIYTEQKFA